jgi:ubiquinone/menaquinone biosynthesis C-methylase UbiE
MTRYVLGANAAEAERIRVQARALWPTTQALLRHAGLARGMRCLDLACGVGEVTLHMADWVGPEGQAVGLDLHAPFLELASHAATERGLLAVFRQENALELQDEAVYDLVYARALLTHVPEPARMITRMVRAAKPGGRIVVEDADVRGSFCYPACPAFARYVEWQMAVIQHHGGDATVGPRVLSLVRDARLHPVHLHIVSPAFYQGEAKRVPLMTMANLREAVTAAGLASPHDVEAIIAELDAFTRDPRTIVSLPRIFQVWGRKP